MLSTCIIHAFYICPAGLQLVVRHLPLPGFVRTMQVCSSETGIYAPGSLPQSSHKCGMLPLLCAGSILDKQGQANAEDKAD